MTAKLMLFCSVHGASAARGRAACPLSESARSAWRATAKKHRNDNTDPESIMITAVAKDDPSHGAVCAVESTAASRLLDDRVPHEKMVRRCLNSAIRSAKGAATKAAKRKASA